MSAKMASSPCFKPNSSLSPEQRQAKQRLKKLAKVQAKIGKVEKRIAHAGRFSKLSLAEDSKAELIRVVNDSDYREEALGFVSEEFRYLFIESDMTAEHDGDDLAPKVSGEQRTSREHERIEMQAKASLTRISNELFLHMYADHDKQANANGAGGNGDVSDEDDDTCRKRKRAEEKQRRLEMVRATKADHELKAKQICRAMTKGKQEESMFDDPAALWGYTRLKFVERGRLIYQSLLKLHPSSQAPAGTAGLSEKQLQLKERMWNALISVDRVCSIGCGPSSDVVGALALRKSLCSENKQTYEAPSILLLDYCVNQWKSAILDIVLPILERNGLCDKERIKCDKTDVTIPELFEDCFGNRNDSGTTLYVTSYLLSEQRDKWHNYYTKLAAEAKRGDIFYFCEPKPWQLHQLIRLTTSVSLEFLWVDSSMFHAELQQGEMRAGPAVLVAMRR